MSYLRQVFSSLARISEPPERTALAFSIGVFYAFSPLVGLHTVLGVGTALFFRLNKIAMMLGVWSNLPWMFVPYYAFATWVGIQLLGVPQGLTIPQVGLSDLLSREFWGWLISQWPLLIPAFAGSLLLSTLLALIAYPLSLMVIRKYRNE